MPSLTTLPLSIQSRILANLYEEPVFHPRQYHLTNAYLPSRRPEPQISLAAVQSANAPLPCELLPPALASPVLAAGAAKLLRGSVSYLTDTNTEGRLAAWVKAFANYVRAVCVTDVGDLWSDSLPRLVKINMIQRLCCDVVDLFREISTNHVRLKVLDLVHVPFDKCRGMEDAMMTGLCATLESCQSTLKELALPVLLESDLCARALETVTLPYLTVFSIDMKAFRVDRGSWVNRHDLQFLGMLQAVDGHADRLHGLTTLEELRVFDYFRPPCNTARKSGCSSGFFRAIKTLRITVDRPVALRFYRELLFCSWFRELQRLYWNGLPYQGERAFMRLSKRLKEVHFCPAHWIKGVQVGAQYAEVRDMSHILNVMHAVMISNGKIRKLITGVMNAHSNAFRTIARLCPNLEYLSLYMRNANLLATRRLIERCEQLCGLEMIVWDGYNGSPWNCDWHELGKVIPRCHPNLRDVAIQTRPEHPGPAVPTSVAVKFFTAVVERVGARAERLLFRAVLKVKTAEQVIDAVRHILDSCIDHSRVLSQLQVDLIPENRSCVIKTQDDRHEAVLKLASSRDMLIQSQLHLNQLDLGICQDYLRKMEPT